MTTDTHSPSADLASPFLCPQCQQSVEARDLVCPACGVELAWAAALAERQVLASMPATASTPYKGDLLIPRSANLKGQVQIQPSRLTVSDLASRLRLFFVPKAEAAQMSLSFDLAPDLPPLSADAEKVWWVLFQLFEHGLKLMAAGDDLTLTVSAAEGKVKFAVRDTGPCIPPTQRDEILHLPPEFISRLADTRGWSLAQVKRIVQAHGTRFGIECLPERGTTVWFELPVVFAL